MAEHLRADKTKTSPPPVSVPTTRDPLWVSVRDGARVVSFPPQQLWSWAEVSRFELQTPVSGSSERLRDARSKLTGLHSQFNLRQLELMLQRRFRTSPHYTDPQSEAELKQSLFPELHFEAAGSTIICWGVHHPAQQRPTPFYLEAALHPSPQSLRIDIFRGFVFGISASSAALLAAELLRAAQLPALPSHPSALQIDPLTEVSLAMCLDRGWKLPSRERALSARASGAHLILTVGDGAEPYLPSGSYADHLKRLKSVSEGEQLLYRGEDHAALSYYQQQESSDFTLFRVAELIRSRALSPMQRAEAIGWLNASLRSDQALGPLARSWQLELRGELEEAADALLEWWELASALPEGHLARDLGTLGGVAAYSRALLLERAQPARALKAFEEARLALPSSLGVLSGAARVALALSDFSLADQRLSEQAKLLESRGLKPEAAWAWVQVAEVRRSLASKSDPKGAERAFARAIELEPTLISAHQGLAAIAEERGEYGLACDRLDRALKIIETKGPARAALEEMRQRFDQLSRPAGELSPPSERSALKGTLNAQGAPLVEPPPRQVLSLEKRPKNPIPPPPRATPSGALDAQALSDAATVLNQRGKTRPAQAATSSPEQGSGEDELDDSMSGDFLQVDYPATSLPPSEAPSAAPAHSERVRSAQPTPPLRSLHPSEADLDIVSEPDSLAPLIDPQQTPALQSQERAEPEGDHSLPPSIEEGDPLDSFIDVDEVSAELLHVEPWEEALSDSMSRSAEPGPLMGELLEAEPLTGQPELARAEPLSRELMSAHLHDANKAPLDDSVAQLDLADVWLSNEASWDVKTEIGAFTASAGLTQPKERSESSLPFKTPEPEGDQESSQNNLAQLKLNYAHLEGESRWEMALLIAQTARDEELNLDEAQRFFWEALRVSEGSHPVASTAAEELAELLTVNQDHEGMLSLYDEMITRELKSATELHRLRAVTLNALSRKEEALEALDLSVAAGGDDSLELRVSILTELGHVEEAVAHLDAAAEAHEGSNRPQARRARAIYLGQAATLLRESYPQESLLRLKHAYQADETQDHLEQWHQLALSVGDPYDQVEATEAYVDYLSKDPNSLQLRVRLLSKLAGELEESSPMHSLSLYQEALEVSPDSFEVADKLCELALKVEALEPLRSGLRHLLPLCLEGEYKGRVMIRLAFTLAALGDHEAGLNELRRAIPEFTLAGEELEELEEPEELEELIRWGRAMCAEVVAEPLLRLIDSSPLSALLPS